MGIASLYEELGYLEDKDDMIKRYLEKSERFGVEYYGIDENLLD
ncbi:hypothetical protein [Ulvibacterium sp.]